MSLYSVVVQANRESLKSTSVVPSGSGCTISSSVKLAYTSNNTIHKQHRVIAGVTLTYRDHGKIEGHCYADNLEAGCSGKECAAHDSKLLCFWDTLVRAARAFCHQVPLISISSDNLRLHVGLRKMSS